MTIKVAGLAGLAALSFFDCSAEAVAAPPVASPFAGFYLGVDAGAGWNTGKTSTVPTQELYDYSDGTVADLATGTRSGFLGGIYTGYNMLVSPMVVLGVEADVNFGRLSATKSDFDAVTQGESYYTYSLNNTVDWSGSLRVRAGLTQQNWLLYVTGGLAIADISSSGYIADGGDLPFYAEASSHQLRAGWTVGLGAEYAVTPNWLIRAEYLYADYGRSEVGAISTGDPLTFTLRTAASVSNVRVGAAYKF